MLDYLLSPGVSPIDAAWKIMVSGGWIPTVLFLLWIGVQAWVYIRQNQWVSKQEFILLAIDVPEEHMQSPMAAEHFFASLWGTYNSINYLDHYWRGKVPLTISVEIVSIEGYVQFLVHTPIQFRDTVEAALYAQYPNCEIVEVEDYTEYGPKGFPSDTHKLWGTEMMETKSHFYPIRTYKYFEDSMATDQTITDPVASLLEALSKIGPGEQIWIQWAFTPLVDSWKDGAKELIDKLAGRKIPKKVSIVERIFSPIGSLFSGLGNILAAGFDKDGMFGGGSANEASSDDPPSLMLHLTPGEKSAIEAIQNKISKAGFHTTMRFIYLAENDKFSVPRGVPGVMGAWKQYAELNLNSVRPLSKTMTSTDYFFKTYRLNRIRDKLIRAYRARSRWRGGPGFILNTEELASFWHFPADYVRTPQLKRSSSRSIEPPPGLPTEQRVKNVLNQPQVVLEGDVEVRKLDLSDNSGPDSLKPKVVLEDGGTVPQKQKNSESPRKSSNTGSLSGGSPPDNLPVG